MIRTVDELGRIVIPREIRKQLNVQEGDTYNIEIIEDRDTNQKNLLLKLQMQHCVLCNNEDDLVKIKDKENKFICHDCLNGIKNL